MNWLGKAVGGALGFMVAGPAGAFLGAFVGHQFDQGLGVAVLREGVLAGPRLAQAAYLRTLFEVLGHVAKSDGRVSEQEIGIARALMQQLRLSPEATQEAIASFTAGKAGDYPLTGRLADLRRLTQGNPEVAEAFVTLQMQAALSAPPISPAKRQLLWQIASALGLTRADFARVEEGVRHRFAAQSGQAPPVTLDGAYAVLGVDAAAADEKVKKAYRRLMSRHHPDKLVSQGLPESMIETAKQRTQEIRTAYERIKSARGLK